MLPMKCFSLTNISIALSSTLVVGTPTSTAVPPSALPKWPLLQAGTICSIVVLIPMQSKAKSAPDTGLPCIVYLPA